MGAFGRGREAAQPGIAAEKRQTDQKAKMIYTAPKSSCPEMSKGSTNDLPGGPDKKAVRIWGRLSIKKRTTAMMK